MRAMNKIDRNFAALSRRIARLPEATPPAASLPLSTLIARVEQAKRAYEIRRTSTAAR